MLRKLTNNFNRLVGRIEEEPNTNLERVPLLSVSSEHPITIQVQAAPAYQSVEEKAELKHKNPEHLTFEINGKRVDINKMLKDLWQLKKLLEIAQSQPPSCLDRFDDFWIKIRMPLFWFLLGSTAITATGVSTTLQFQDFSGHVKSALQDWKNLRSPRNISCALDYNYLTVCNYRGENFEHVEVAGISNDSDSVCYEALYNLCSYACMLHMTPFRPYAFPSECMEEFKTAEIGASLLLGIFIGVMVFGFLYLCSGVIANNISNNREEPLNRKTRAFSKKHKKLLSETQTMIGLTSTLEELSGETKNKIDHFRFFAARHRLIVEHLPIPNKQTANPVGIIDEYLGFGGP